MPRTSRGFTVQATPLALRMDFTASKCASDFGPRKSINRGAASTTACIAGFLVSRMRNGLLCKRRRASSSSTSTCCSRYEISAARVKLAIPPALRTLMAEHGPHVVEALASVIQHGMLSNCANHPCSRFGTQSEMLAIETILERVHLFFDDVRDLTEATNKQRRGLNNRRTDVAIGISSHKGADLGLQPLPSGGFRRQDIVHAFHGYQLFRLGRRSAFFVTHNSSFLYLATIRRTSPTISR